VRTVTEVSYYTEYKSSPETSLTPRVERFGKGDTVKDISVSLDRSVWVPNPFDLVPPLRGSGLVDSATKIADLSFLMISRFR